MCIDRFLNLYSVPLPFEPILSQDDMVVINVTLNLVLKFCSTSICLYFMLFFQTKPTNLISFST